MKRPKPSAFKKLRTSLVLSPEKVSELLGVSVRTVQRWDIQGSPAWAIKFLKLYDRKYLSGLGDDWNGVYISRGSLYFGRQRIPPRELKRLHLYIDVYNRLDMARMRYYQDSAPSSLCLGIVFGSPAFDSLANRASTVAVQDEHRLNAVIP